MSTVKEEARKLIEDLPDQVTWDDIMYEIYVRKKINMDYKQLMKAKSFPMKK